MAEKVSIIIPVYNMGSSLEKCVKSILCQTYENIEVILVDDGSSDNSYEVCKMLCDADNRVKCIHTENRGSGPARNTGIKASEGRYLYFPDADDYIAPEAVSVLVNAANCGEYDLVVFGYECLNADGSSVFEKNYKPHTASGNDIRNRYFDYLGMTNKFSIQGAPWNKFFDGNIVLENNIEFPPLRRHQDEGFISRYVSCCKQVRFIPDILYSYYRNSTSVEWKKYPVDYIDAVTGLDKVWKETILTWNPQDTECHLEVKRMIFTKIVKALELVYSPKHKLNFFTITKWLKETCKKSEFYNYDFSSAQSKYQFILLLLAKARMYRLMSFALYAGNIKNVIRQGK